MQPVQSGDDAYKTKQTKIQMNIRHETTFQNPKSEPSTSHFQTKLGPVHEKTKLLRTVLEKEITRITEESNRSSTMEGRSRLPAGYRGKELQFSNLESSIPSLSLQEVTNERGSGSLAHWSNGGSNSDTDLSAGILTNAQMSIGSFEDSFANNGTDYLLQRLQQQIVLHNTLLDASEKFSKSPSIENLVRKCMKGTKALKELKQRVAAYKMKQEQKQPHGAIGMFVREVPNILKDAINCAEDLHDLSETIIQRAAPNVDDLNRSSATASAIMEASMRLKEIENAWKNFRLSDEESGSSLGLLHLSHLLSSCGFLNISQTLTSTFERINESIEDVLRTPNTASLNQLKQHLSQCKKLLESITLNQSLLLDETSPSMHSTATEEESLLKDIFEELDRSAKSEIEAFLEIWKSPEKERFLQITNDVINDLSHFRDETNHLLIRVESGKPSSDRKKHIKERLAAIRSGFERNPPLTTPILLKDYVDEIDLIADECEKSVHFSSLSHKQAECMPKDHLEEVHDRLKLLLLAMDHFEQILNATGTREIEEQKSIAILEQKMDHLMHVISDFIAVLRTDKK